MTNASNCCIILQYWNCCWISGKGNRIDKSSVKEKAPEVAERWGWSALHLNVNVIMRQAVRLTSDKILVNHYHQHLVAQLIIKEDEVEDSKQSSNIRENQTLIFKQWKKIRKNKML